MSKNHANPIPGKKSAARKPRQMWTNYRCSDQGLAGFACHTSTAPDSEGKETRRRQTRKEKCEVCMERGFASHFPTRTTTPFVPKKSEEGLFENMGLMRAVRKRL